MLQKKERNATILSKTNGEIIVKMEFCDDLQSLVIGLPSLQCRLTAHFVEADFLQVDF